MRTLTNCFYVLVNGLYTKRGALHTSTPHQHPTPAPHIALHTITLTQSPHGPHYTHMFLTSSQTVTCPVSADHKTTVGDRHCPNSLQSRHTAITNSKSWVMSLISCCILIAVTVCCYDWLWPVYKYLSLDNDK